MPVFITGASSGLGAAFARHYAAQGHTLGLLARRADRLQELIKSLPGEHHIYVVDVCDRDALHAADPGHEDHANQAPEKNQFKGVEVRRRIFDANPHH